MIKKSAPPQAPPALEQVQDSLPDDDEKEEEAEKATGTAALLISPSPAAAARRSLSVSLSMRFPEGQSRIRTSRKEKQQRGSDSNSNSHHHIADAGGGGAVAEAEESESVWMKRIILGERCKVDDEEELVVYDVKGNRQRNYHPRAPRSLPVSRTNSFAAAETKTAPGSEAGPAP